MAEPADLTADLTAAWLDALTCRELCAVLLVRAPIPTPDGPPAAPMRLL